MVSTVPMDFGRICSALEYEKARFYDFCCLIDIGEAHLFVQRNPAGVDELAVLLSMV